MEEIKKICEKNKKELHKILLQNYIVENSPDEYIEQDDIIKIKNCLSNILKQIRQIKKNIEEDKTMSKYYRKVDEFVK